MPLAARASPRQEGCGTGGTLQPGPWDPGPSFSFAVSFPWGEGGGTGISVALALPSLPHLQDSVFMVLSWDTDTPTCWDPRPAPGSAAGWGMPHVWTVLPSRLGQLRHHRRPPCSRSPQQACSRTYHGVPPSTHVLKRLGCPLGKVNGRRLATGGFGVLQAPG